MNIFGKSIHELTEIDILTLVDEKARESLNLEFKEDKYSNTDSGKKEFCKDISGLANAYGGFLIIGIEEDNDNCAKAIKVVSEAEKFRTQFLDVAKRGIDPPIPGLDSRTIQVENANIVVFHIPSSVQKPHMVTKNEDNRFYRRYPANVEKMCRDEVKDAVLQTVSLAQSVRDFSERMLEQCRNKFDQYFYLGITPVKMHLDQGNYQKTTADWLLQQTCRQYNHCLPSNAIRPALEGYTCDDEGAWFLLTHGGHMQYFCALDYILYEQVAGQNTINPGHLVHVIHSLIRLWNLYDDGNPSNSGVFVRFGIKTIARLHLPYISPSSISPIVRDRDLGPLNGLVLDAEQTYGFNEFKSHDIPKKVADKLWNAFGLEKCLYYDEQGKVLLTNFNDYLAGHF